MPSKKLKPAKMLEPSISFSFSSEYKSSLSINSSQFGEIMQNLCQLESMNTNSDIQFDPHRTSPFSEKSDDVFDISENASSYALGSTKTILSDESSIYKSTKPNFAENVKQKAMQSSIDMSCSTEMNTSMLNSFRNLESSPKILERKGKNIGKNSLSQMTPAVIKVNKCRLHVSKETSDELKELNCENDFPQINYKSRKSKKFSNLLDSKATLFNLALCNDAIDENKPSRRFSTPPSVITFQDKFHKAKDVNTSLTVIDSEVDQSNYYESFEIMNNLSFQMKEILENCLRENEEIGKRTANIHQKGMGKGHGASWLKQKNMLRPIKEVEGMQMGNHLENTLKKRSDSNEDMTKSHSKRVSIVSRNFTYDNLLCVSLSKNDDSPYTTKSRAFLNKEQKASRKSKQEKLITLLQKTTFQNNTNRQWIREFNEEKRIGYYKILKNLGKGNFSNVKKGFHILTKEFVAIKILDRNTLSESTVDFVLREISIMELLHHPHIIRLYEVVKSMDKIYIILEYASMGELFTLVCKEGRLSEENAKRFLPKLSQLFNTCKGCIHRDIKAENVFLVDTNIVKVGDFGFSIKSNDDLLKTHCGSPPYAAPELFEHNNYKGEPVDVWALGILLYFIVAGKLPFTATTFGKLRLQILNGDYTIPQEMSARCSELISQILQVSVEKRITLDKIRENAWLKGEKFPLAIPAFKINPPENFDENDDDLKEVKKELEEIGITNLHIKEALRRVSRNSIIGTYRIALHKVQKAKMEIPNSPVQTIPEVAAEEKSKQGWKKLANMLRVISVLEKRDSSQDERRIINEIEETLKKVRP